MKKIDHVAIAVRSIESALKIYAAGLDLRNCIIEEIPEQQTRVALLPVGDCRIELLESMSADSPVARFIARRGEGLHHICFEVDDLAQEIERVRDAGLRFIDEHPRVGAEGCLIVFLHPSSTAGVLIELSQPRPHNPSE